MSALDLFESLKPITPMRYEAGPLPFQKKSASVSRVIPSRSLPMRAAIVGNHLPRQCGIATSTTDLCDAVATQYGADGLLVVAVNDPQSRDSYPARVQFEITEGLVSTGRAVLRRR